MRTIRPLLALGALLATTPALSAQTVVRTQTHVERMVFAQGPVTIDEARYIATRSGAIAWAVPSGVAMPMPNRNNITSAT